MEREDVEEFLGRLRKALAFQDLELAESSESKEQAIESIVTAVRVGKRMGDGWSADVYSERVVVRYKHKGNQRLEQGVLVGREGRTVTYRLGVL